MRRRILPSALILAAACTATTSSPPAPPTPGATAAVPPEQAFTTELAPLERAIRERIAREPAGEVAVAIIDLETGRFLGIHEHLEMHAASTMKVGVLLELYRAAAAGELALEDEITVKNVFRSLADTSHFTMGADNDAELFRMVGSRITLRELARRMIVVSSNLATNMLIERLGAERVRETLARVGASGLDVHRGTQDNAAFRVGLNNTTDAAGLAYAMAAFARCDILPRKLCEDARSILLAQEFRSMIPAGLPAGTRVAHKTGSITGINHDAAIIYPDGSPPYVLVVLTRGAESPAAARRIGADVARLSWDALGPGGSLRPAWPAGIAELVALHERFRVNAFPAPTLRHDELWSALMPIIDGAPHITQERVGESSEGRAIRLVRTGTGPTRVLFWSQMHGDETTASRALTDLFNYIANADDARTRRWRERLTIMAVPMLNPDGAEAHRRRSAFGIDINRDARMLSTPEGRTLKGVQERVQPHFGFNLHDQNPRSRVGNASRTAAMSLLAPPPDRDATDTPNFVAAKHLTAHIALTLSPLLGRHLTRYDDSYNARAFGDGMQSWGVATVLIETGSWRRDESKHYLRRTNFIALAAALDAIADGSHENADVAAYATLPPNGRGLNDLVIRGGTVVLPGMPPHRLDIAIDAASVGGPASTQISDIGDLAENQARETLDATGLFIHPGSADGSNTVQPGMYPDLVLRRGTEPDSEPVWIVDGVRLRRVAPLDGR